MLVEDVPARVLTALTADQPARSINDICSEILSARYGIPYQPSGRKRRGLDHEGALILKLPEPVWAEMKYEAAPYGTLKDVAIRALSEHYGLEDGS